MTGLDLVVSYLQAQRRHVLGTLDGLDESALLAPVLPSGWSCAGLVRHLALDVERFWFRGTVAAELSVIENQPDDAWTVPAGTTAAAALELYRRECDLADAVLAQAAASDPPRWWPDFFGDYHLDTVEEVVLHVIVETAAHAGHLDAARELLDGRQWLVLA